jgi:hypothetical protein
MLQVCSEAFPMMKIILLLKLAKRNSTLALSTVIRPMIWS